MTTRHQPSVMLLSVGGAALLVGAAAGFCVAWIGKGLLTEWGR